MKVYTVVELDHGDFVCVLATFTNKEQASLLASESSDYHILVTELLSDIKQMDGRAEPLRNCLTCVVTGEPDQKRCMECGCNFKNWTNDPFYNEKGI